MNTPDAQAHVLAVSLKNKGSPLRVMAHEVSRAFPTMTASAVAKVLRDTADEVTPQELAVSLAAAGFSATDVAPAVKGIFPNLSAMEMGNILKAVYTSPAITADQMRQALTAAPYPPNEVNGAVAALFPSTVTYRKEGPAGASGGGSAFDDLELAKQANKPITKLIIRAGNIIDSVQAIAGDTALPHHGGNRGSGNEIQLDAGDLLTEVSGYSGTWFGRVYILQLTLKTKRGKTYGPFGNMDFSNNRTRFSFSAGAGQIAGFHGSIISGSEADGSTTFYVNSLGVIIRDGA